MVVGGDEGEELHVERGKGGGCLYFDAKMI